MTSIQYYALLPVVLLSRWLMGSVADRGVGAMVGTVRSIGRISDPLTRLPRGVGMEAGHVGGVSGSWITPHGAPEAPVILYLHGGAFVTPLSAQFRMVAAYLGLAAGVRVFAPDYRLLPDHAYPAAHQDCFDVYRDLLELGPVVVGDSTGGVLALATLLRARDARLPQPAVCILLSPAVDLGSKDLGVRRPKDRFVHPKFVTAGHTAYVNGYDTAGADLGPIHQDLRGLAPIRVMVGEHEIFRTEVDRLVEATSRQGVTVEVRHWPHMWHGWYVMADRLPEGRRALEEAGAWIRADIARRSD